MEVSAIGIYPIKGCRGHAVSFAEVDRLGLVGDRRLMLVDADDRFISQREDPTLATLVPNLTGDQLRVGAPEVSTLELALDPDGAHRTVTLWDKTIVAVDQGDHAAEWFTLRRGAPTRLVWFIGPAERAIDPTYAPRPGAETAFTDGYPLLVVVAESLADLNGRLAEPVPMSRFRPNVVVTGGSPWCEDAWQELSIGSLACDAVKPCARCVVTTTDQRTGERHPTREPLRTLASFRTQQPFGAIFGQNVVPRGTGRIAVGDRVTVGP